MLLAMILLQLHGVKFPGGFPDQNNKKKRQRTSPDQLAILEQIFQTDKMPSQQTRVQLADQLGMSSRRVQIWFQNKRAKVKRGLGKSSDVCLLLFLPFSPSLLFSTPSFVKLLFTRFFFRGFPMLLIPLSWMWRTLRLCHPPPACPSPRHLWFQIVRFMDHLPLLPHPHFHCFLLPQRLPPQALR